MKRRLQVVCLALALCAAALTGCAGGGSGSGAGDASKSVKVSSNAVKVNNMEEFLEAVKPGAEIVIAGGYHNLSDYVNDFWLADEAESFNDEHEYVEIEDCYDGAQAVIKNADGLTIRGDGTEIVIDPRYGTVLTFEKCDDLKLSGLTLGHTETGECAGNVVELSACKNVELRDMDLYGCGMIALECSNGAQDVYVYDSQLRDCSWGPLDVYGATGKIELHNCSLTGSGGGGSYNSEARLQLFFDNCEFGVWETGYWAYTKGVEFKDCTWSESTDDPDYEEGEDDYDYEEGGEITFNPDALKAQTIDLSSDTFWVGYSTLNTETGEEGDIPSGANAADVYMYLNTNGTGELSAYYADHTVPFLWEVNAENPAKLDLTTLHDGAFQITTYGADPGDNAGRWLCLTTPQGRLWMF